jgi:hypothetical protein
MEQSKAQYFDIVAGVEYIIRQVIEKYNKDYKTDFEIVEFENRGGVIFAVIKFVEATLADVFQLGSFFGMSVQNKRHTKEINF